MIKFGDTVLCTAWRKKTQCFFVMEWEKEQAVSFKK